MEHPNYPGFCAVQTSFDEWFNNKRSERDGERVLWIDGSAHRYPEFPTARITVLRRVENCDPARGTIFTHANAPGARVYDADVKPKLEITKVISVDIGTGRIKVPRLVDGRHVLGSVAGELVTEIIQFDRIDTEIDMDLKIKAFHCYGRRA